SSSVSTSRAITSLTPSVGTTVEAPLGSSSKTTGPDSETAGSVSPAAIAPSTVSSLAATSTTATSSMRPVASAIVGRWSFDGVEVAVTVDSSGNNNTAVLNNGAWTSAGRFGSALSLNGASGFAQVAVPRKSVLDISSNPITLSAWIKPRSTNILQAI